MPIALLGAVATFQIVILIVDLLDTYRGLGWFLIPAGVLSAAAILGASLRAVRGTGAARTNLLIVIAVGFLWGISWMLFRK